METDRRNENQEMACRVALLTPLDCPDPDVPKQEEFVDWWKMKKPISLLFFLSYRALSDVGVRQRGGQILKVSTAGAHPGEGVGPSDEAVAAPRGAQDTARLWNVGIPCGQRE